MRPEVDTPAAGAPAAGSPGPRHVAIIMDGNGRWARARGMPRTVGHERGAHRLEEVFECAGELGIRILTLYAFSSDNWSRPRGEIEALMALFRRFFDAESARGLERGVRLQVIGRRDRLTPALVEAIERAERVTAPARRLLVRAAIDYSSRWAIRSAASELTDGGGARPDFRRALARAMHGDPVPDPDLIVRTGGEQRLSDFLLWESAYAELVFLPRMWPDFGPEDLRRVVAEFHGRQRRFGGLAASAG